MSHQKQITVYTTPTCPYCKLVKDFLSESGQPFREINVSVDDKAAQKMVTISGQMGVPVLDIGGFIVVGWDRNAIERALGEK